MTRVCRCYAIATPLATPDLPPPGQHFYKSKGIDVGRARFDVVNGDVILDKTVAAGASMQASVQGEL